MGEIFKEKARKFAESHAEQEAKRIRHRLHLLEKLSFVFTDHALNNCAKIRRKSDIEDMPREKEGRSSGTR